MLSLAFVPFLSLAVLLGLAGTGAAEGPVGVWLDEDKKGHIEIYPCAEGRAVSDPDLLKWMCDKTSSGGTRLCGRVTHITQTGLAELRQRGKNPDDVRHKPVLCIEPSAGSNPQWTGGLYSVYLDKRAKAYVTSRSADELHVKGCVLAVLCAEDVWTRVR